MARHIVPNFHGSLPWPHYANDDALFPVRKTKFICDFGMPTDEEWWVDEIAGHDWEWDQIKFVVRWTIGDHTWENYETCKDLTALNDYFSLQGVTRWQQLPQVNEKTSVRDVPEIASWRKAMPIGAEWPLDLKPKTQITNPDKIQISDS